MYHPNVWSSGEICLTSIQDANYSPAMKMEGILMGLVSLLSDPNLGSPANGDAARNWNNSNIKQRGEQRHRL